jgi:hypothetical protein
MKNFMMEKSHGIFNTMVRARKSDSLKYGQKQKYMKLNFKNTHAPRDHQFLLSG